MLEISILIPIYNFDTLPLVEQLMVQLEKSELRYEIVVIDDCSNEVFKQINKPVEEFSNVNYIELASNIGRSKIRNLLAETAKFENLLFLDGDIEIFNQSYIEQYAKYLNLNFDVIVGGTSYFVEKPAQKDLILHWKAGKFREEKLPIVRNQNPYYSFSLNNMLIKKSLFSLIKLEEKITTYGHEDTRFGISLKSNNYTVLHIDNPVYHIGLNSAESYLAKTEEAVKNLQKLHELYGIGAEIKLYKYYILLTKLRLRYVFYTFFEVFKMFMVKNLKSKSPSLFVFDLYKLYLLTKLNLK